MMMDNRTSAIHPPPPLRLSHDLFGHQSPTHSVAGERHSSSRASAAAHCIPDLHPDQPTRVGTSAPGTATAESTIHLRRKPNLSAITTSPPRKTAARPSAPTSPVKACLPDERPTSARSGNSIPGSLTRARTNSLRSLAQKKPPASHSSYGVETTLGPPPSYSTQRTLSQDRVWKVDPAQRHKSTSERDSEDHVPGCDETESARDQSDSDKELLSTDVTSSPETLDTPSIATPTIEEAAEKTAAMEGYGIHLHDDEADRDRTIRGFGVRAADEASKGSSSDDRKSEDLFLNIAQTDSGRQDRAESRRSRISLPFMSSARSRGSRADEASSYQTEFDPALLSPRDETPPDYGKRLALGQHTIRAASEHPRDEPSRAGTQTSIARAASSITPGVAARDGPSYLHEPLRLPTRRLSSAATDVGYRGFPRQHVPLRSPRLASESHAAERPRYADHGATESTISTTAPSTVWDELDDLKSRIRKLELTGKLPSSSAAAMTSAERPRTATTAATTLSSSPKNKPALSALPSAIEGIPSTVHPLLHEALSQAKSVVSNDVYQKLQATASDALQLVALLGTDMDGSTVGGISAAERQIKRRAESMCRGLTELAITLSAESNSLASPGYRPVSRDPSMRQVGSVARRMSNEPADAPPVTTRVHSRLDSRRASLQFGTARTSYSSPDTAVHTPPSQLQRQPSSASGVQRASALLQRRRAPGYLDGAGDDDDDNSSQIRPVSRAMTDVGGPYRRPARDRTSLSREYTSQHPMPTPPDASTANPLRTPLPAGLGSNFHLRRKYASPPSAAGTQEGSPVTPNQEPFGRITLIQRERDVGSVESTPESVTVTRGSGGTRRSLGLASRIGSSVGSRLRAVRAERNASGSREQLRPPPPPKETAAVSSAPDVERHGGYEGPRPTQPGDSIAATYGE